MIYQCSYCKSGPMVTKDQYSNHINGTKHKKKAFQLQAPNAGIEYEEFRPKSETKPVTFVQATEDFPVLTQNLPVVNLTAPIRYGDILESFPAPVVRHGPENGANYELEDQNEESGTTIDDIFFKDISKLASAKHTLDNYAKQNKTHAAALNEVAVAMGWKLEFNPHPASDSNFGFMVIIDEVPLTEGEGENKKDARQNASINAIKIIRMKFRDRKNKLSQGDPTIVNKPTFGAPNQSTSCAFNNKEQRIKYIGPKKEELPADVYCRLTIEKFLELESLPNNKFRIPRRYAAFIMTESNDQLAKDGLVVAFGAGSGILRKTQEIMDHPGFHITNFDSLVLAKRSFQCFLYNQLSLLLDRKIPKNKFDKIYFIVGKDGKVKLKEGCRVHLFMSHAPYGDCVQSIPHNWIEPMQLPPKEIERDRKGIVDPIMTMTYENSEQVKQPGHIRVLKGGKNNSEWTSLVEYREQGNKIPDHMIMSPTDKLTLWVHAGIQGAFLSHVMAPLHLYSIQVAHNYMHAHFARAIICRVPAEKLEDEVDMSKYKDPFIARVSKLPEPIQSVGIISQNVSYNWYSNPVTQLPEIINNDTGLVHEDSLFKLPDGDSIYHCSRLSKVCMLLRLKKLFRVATEYYAHRPELQRTRSLQGIGDAAQYRYHLFKNSAVKYRRLKRCLFKALHDRCLGDWAPNNAANEFDLVHYYELTEMD